VPEFPIAENDETMLVRAILAARPALAPDAESELCRRLAPRIRLYGLRHLRDGHAAADLVQQVLLITLQRLRAGELRQPEQIVSFVLGTARLTAVDLKRGRARREKLLESYPVEGVDVLPHISSEADRERLLGCLGRLTERERSVVVLSFCADTPTEEVALEVGLEAGNVRVIRHRALHRLRECLDVAEVRS
jgi:RNA polymerase sigma-70 factor (ECF subfamily)